MFKNIKLFYPEYRKLEIKPAGLNLEFEMSVLGNIGGHWDVFF